MKLYIGFDQKNKYIRILSSEKNGTMQVQALKYQSMLFSEEFFGEFQLILADYIKNNSVPANTMAYLIMPDNTVAFETFDLPYMNKAKMQKALEAELANEYDADFLKDKELSKFLISSTRQYATYGVQFTDKKNILQLYKIMREVKLIPRDKTYSGESLLTSIFHLQPHSRGRSFVVADIRADYTEIIICSRGKLMGTAIYQQGTQLINNPDVCEEYLVTEHTAAEIAVINAREIARAKSLTMSVDEEEPVGPVLVSEDGKTELPVNPEPADDDDEIDEEEPIEETADVTESSEVAETAETAAMQDATAPTAAIGPKVKVYKKQKRRLPKFMQREVPEDTAKIAYENFRIILKWIILYARQAHMTSYINDPEFIVINLPDELHYLLDMANEEQGEENIPILVLKGAEKKPPVVTENLDLYGATFMGSFLNIINFNKKS